MNHSFKRVNEGFAVIPRGTRKYVISAIGNSFMLLGIDLLT